MDEFTLTENHVKLVRNFNVSWAYYEAGAPWIDHKRPYGNSDWLKDIAHIIGMELFEDADGEEHFTKQQIEDLKKWHYQAGKALEVILQAGTFELGLYRRKDIFEDWEKA